MLLRKGKTKSLLESSIDCALLSVELYNKPRAPFRVESFITHMIMAWTRLLQANFNLTIGETYFYKEPNGRYKIIDAEKKAWELKTCIIKYGKLTDSVKTNLEFFIKLRNKIEHRTISKDEIGLMIFGECQSLLYNFENELIRLFGSEYAINESLAYSLQFSRLRSAKQINANKQLLSTEVKELKDFIEKYRTNIKEEVFNSQEFSIKLIQVPKIANTSRNDLAIEFVNWNSLSEEDRINYEKITTLIKDKVQKTEVINPGKLKPGIVIKHVNDNFHGTFNKFDHKCLLYIFSIRPTSGDIDDLDPFETNAKYCHYDEAHNDYLFQESWSNFILNNLTLGRINRDFWKSNYDTRKKVNIETFEVQ
ncbi:DUF3644 domain-containing protein [Emticicia sp.]|uniref:DUF3644 domain-containing protein n=1 Tax=Emticicia sp. TaxID=1930953 RepID=UPI0037509C53